MTGLPIAGMRRPDLHLAPLVATVTVLLVIVAVTRQGGQLPIDLVGGVIAVVVIAFLSNRPTAALMALPPLVLLGTFVFAAMLQAGVPAQVVRAMGFGKDAAALALVVAAVTQLSRGGRLHVGLASLLAIAYVTLLTSYLLLPVVDPTATTANLNEALLGWRYDVYLPAVVLAVSSLAWSTSDQDRVETVIIACAVIAGLGGIIQTVAPGLWQVIVIDLFHVERYQTLVLKVPVTASQLLREGIDPTSGRSRAGSVTFEPVYFAFQLLPAWCLSLGRLAGRRTPGPVTALSIIGAGILVSETRSAAFCAAVAVAVVAMVTTQLPTHRRATFAVSLVALAVPAVLIAGSSGLGTRLNSFINGSDRSSTGHSVDVASALTQLRAQPLGTGLGTSSGVSQRFSLANGLIVENGYLKVGVEMGVLALALFAALLLSLALRLLVNRRMPGVLAGAALAVAAVVGSYYQDIWTDFGVSATYACVLGLALSRTLRRDRAEPVDHLPTEPSPVSSGRRVVLSS